VKYLILGSEGQIGHALKGYLTDNGQEVIEYDIVRSPYEDLRLGHNTLLEGYIDNADFVFFLAFDVGGSRYLKKYQHTFEFIHNNIALMKETFGLLRKYQKPFIFASSQMSNMDHSPYGLCKAIGEKYTECLNGLVVKFWNVYGYEQDLEKAHVITDFILKAMDSGEINMLTDGQETRQFLHAEDCSRALHKLSLDFDNVPKDAGYHITSFEWISILKVADIISSQLGGVSVQPSKGKDTVQKNQKNEPDEHILNYWEPQITLEDGIKDITRQIKDARTKD